MSTRNVVMSGLGELGFRVLRAVIGFALIVNVLWFGFLGYAWYKQTGFGFTYQDVTVAFSVCAASLFGLDAVLRVDC